MDEQQPSARRFHAACVLADDDPDHANWTDAGFTKFIAEQLVGVSPVYVGQYQELLRPVAASLVPALSEIFKDPARGELAKTLANTLLADYAAKDPEALSELVLVADASSDKSLFPVLQQHQETAVKNMEAVLDRRLEPDWKDTPLDPAWTEPSAAVRARIEAAHGLLSERYAFCQDMPWDTFQEIAETLRASGYHPTRVRPNVTILRANSGASAVVAGLPTEPPPPDRATSSDRRSAECGSRQRSGETCGRRQSGVRRPALNSRRPALNSAGSGDPRSTVGDLRSATERGQETRAQQQETCAQQQETRAQQCLLLWSPPSGLATA